MSPTADERSALADQFERLGPDAPTILPGWDAAQLLDHLLVRERYGHHAMGARLPGVFGRHSRAALEDLRALPWAEQTELLREGPPAYSPVGRVDSITGNAEILIHHEDLRRAQPGWQRRDLSPAQQHQVWRTVRLFSRAMLRVPADITLVSALGGIRRSSRRARGTLRVHGEPLELLLWVSGRDEIAQVRIHGDTGGLEALQEGRRGM